ncbi:MAG: hypothetical protein KAG10_02755 [Methylococcales bacterium]|nr:hypothetical protein [Methylococcales bacterium]MCK5898095.1 hypothetical protein [Methylococcales bacterium]MCK5924793.1 hypothetical protein [Methylococcales bacterium]
MSNNPFPLFTIKENDAPKNIEAKIPLLIRLYLTLPDQQTAAAVATHINTLLAAPHYIKNIKTRCQFRRLSEHWKLLAWLEERPIIYSHTQPSLKMELKQITSLKGLRK